MSIQNARRITGTIVEGHQVASGKGESSPYPDSSIKMQSPHFLARGIDISGYYPGTLNVSISPYTIEAISASLRLDLVEWTHLHPPETFSFSPCKLIVAGAEYDGLVYYPHPETKKAHFQMQTILELLTTYIEGLSYGDEVDIIINSKEIIITDGCL